MVGLVSAGVRACVMSDAPLTSLVVGGSHPPLTL